MDDNKIVIYQTEDGQTQIDVRLEKETVWLTQAQMAELFQKDRTVITRHINNVFKEGELEKEQVCAKFAHTTQHGAMVGRTQIQETVLYNLDVIISVVPQQQSHSLSCRRIKAYSRQHACCPHADDCRKPNRGKGRDGKGCGKPH